jgi:hypothetical protein
VAKQDVPEPTEATIEAAVRMLLRGVQRWRDNYADSHPDVGVQLDPKRYFNAAIAELSEREGREADWRQAATLAWLLCRMDELLAGYREGLSAEAALLVPAHPELKAQPGVKVTWEGLLIGTAGFTCLDVVQANATVAWAREALDMADTEKPRHREAGQGTYRLNATMKAVSQLLSGSELVINDRVKKIERAIRSGRDADDGAARNLQDVQQAMADVEPLNAVAAVGLVLRAIGASSELQDEVEGAMRDHFAPSTSSKKK